MHGNGYGEPLGEVRNSETGNESQERRTLIDNLD
jgi:hypothetical protein